MFLKHSSDHKRQVDLRYFDKRKEYASRQKRALSLHTFTKTSIDSKVVDRLNSQTFLGSKDSWKHPLVLAKVYVLGTNSTFEPSSHYLNGLIFSVDPLWYMDCTQSVQYFWRSEWISRENYFTVLLSILNRILALNTQFLWKYPIYVMYTLCISCRLNILHVVTNYWSNVIVLENVVLWPECLEHNIKFKGKTLEFTTLFYPGKPSYGNIQKFKNWGLLPPGEGGYFLIRG